MSLKSLFLITLLNFWNLNRYWLKFSLSRSMNTSMRQTNMHMILHMNTIVHIVMLKGTYKVTATFTDIQDSPMLYYNQSVSHILLSTSYLTTTYI